MRINTISNNNFQGEFKIPEALPVHKQEFAEKIINYNVFGTTNKKYLRGSNFDINILNGSANDIHNNKLDLYIKFKYLGTSNFDRGIECTDSKLTTVKSDDSVYNAAKIIRSLIESTDDYIDENFPTQYNNNFQKLLIKIAMFLGIF